MSGVCCDACYGDSDLIGSLLCEGKEVFGKIGEGFCCGGSFVVVRAFYRRET